MTDIPPMPCAFGEVCQHGKLKRQCDVCHLEWEVHTLRAANLLLSEKCMAADWLLEPNGKLIQPMSREERIARRARWIASRTALDAAGIQVGVA